MTDTRQLSDAVAEILATADADIAARKPVCISSGRCCHFEEYGHRLYVTAAELHHFAHVHAPPEDNRKSQISNFKSEISNLKSPLGAPEDQSKIEGQKSTISLPQFFAAESPQGCPYQIDKLCTAREARPLGCRIYFCDENAQSWQNEVYEKYHAQLRDLHARFAIPYRYIEWRAALRELVAPHEPQA